MRWIISNYWNILKYKDIFFSSKYRYQEVIWGPHHQAKQAALMLSPKALPIKTIKNKFCYLSSIPKYGNINNEQSTKPECRWYEKRTCISELQYHHRISQVGLLTPAGSPSPAKSIWKYHYTLKPFMPAGVINP